MPKDSGENFLLKRARKNAPAINKAAFGKVGLYNDRYEWGAAAQSNHIPYIEDKKVAYNTLQSMVWNVINDCYTLTPNRRLALQTIMLNREEDNENNKKALMSDLRNLRHALLKNGESPSSDLITRMNFVLTLACLKVRDIYQIFYGDENDVPEDLQNAGFRINTDEKEGNVMISESIAVREIRIAQALDFYQPEDKNNGRDLQVITFGEPAISPNPDGHKLYVVSEYHRSHSGKAIIYNTPFAGTFARIGYLFYGLLYGARSLFGVRANVTKKPFSNTRSAYKGNGTLFANSKATLSKRGFFANTRASLPIRLGGKKAVSVESIQDPEGPKVPTIKSK